MSMVVFDPNNNCKVEALRIQHDKMIKKYRRKHQEKLRARGEGTLSREVEPPLSKS